MYRKITIEIIIALLMLLFFYAAISKFATFRTFRFQLGLAPYIGRFAALLSVIIPIGELLIAGLLVVPKTRYKGLWLSFLSMLVFTVYVGLMLLYGKHLPCACAGLIQHLKWPQHLVFNAVFTLISFAGITLYKKHNKTERDNGNSYNLSFHPQQ